MRSRKRKLSASEAEPLRMRSTRDRRAGSPRVLFASAWMMGPGRFRATTWAVSVGVGVAVAGAVASMAREVDGLWEVEEGDKPFVGVG